MSGHTPKWFRYFRSGFAYVSNVFLKWMAMMATSQGFGNKRF